MAISTYGKNSHFQTPFLATHTLPELNKVILEGYNKTDIHARFRPKKTNMPSSTTEVKQSDKQLQKG